MITAEENEPQPLRIIGTPKRRNGKYVLDEFAILGKECGWICPRCNNEVRICPTQAGEQSFVCKACNASFTVRVDAEATTFLLGKKPAPASANAAVAAIDTAAANVAAAGIAAAKSAVGTATPIVSQQQAQKPAKGILLMPDDPVSPPAAPTPQPAPTPTDDSDDEDSETRMVGGTNGNASGAQQGEAKALLQWGGFFSRKRYTLRTGANIIGRKDKKTPSDVEFDDPEMSRRSVKIDAIPDGKGSFSYTLTVLKALNAVKVNSKQMAQGSSIQLKHNDTIVMGKTTMTLKVEG